MNKGYDSDKYIKKTLPRIRSLPILTRELIGGVFCLENKT